MDEPTESTGPVGLAMVITMGAPSLDAEAWKHALTRFGVALVGEVNVGAGGATLNVELESGSTLGVVLIPKAVPGDDLEPYRDGYLLWPDAKDTIEPHEGHVLVILMGGEDPLQGRIDHTVATVATALALEAPGIYWGQVPHVSSTEVALNLLQGSLGEGELPMMLWLAIDFARLPDGRVSALTRGLASFDHPDLWLTSAEMDPGDLAGQALSIASYVIGEGAVLQPGQTLGADEEDKNTIEAVEAPDGRGVEVLRVDFA